MMAVRSYKDLNVWQRSVDLTEAIYQVTKRFPREEVYGLTSQMRRCVVSIASNIAEGSKRNNRKEFVQFVSIAMGSLAELETQLIITNRIKVLDDDSYGYLLGEAEAIGKMLSNLRKALSSD